MKHWFLVALGCALIGFGVVAAPLTSAAQPAPAMTPVPMTKPDFSSMMFLVGTWSCTQPLRGKTRPETDVNSMGMDGMWMVTQTTAPPFDQYRTATITGTGYLGYDPTIKQWVQLGADSGGGYGMESSPGWQGNTITWNFKGLDGTTGTDVFTKVSDTQTTDVNTATDPQGKTNKVTITCTKSGS